LPVSSQNLIWTLLRIQRSPIKKCDKKAI
jgi:hypothetical protein